MDVLDCIKTRRSVRKFKHEEVPRDIIYRIVDAGRLAPSAGNLQNWKFIMVFDDDLKKALADASFDQVWMDTASVIVCIVSEPKTSEKFYGVRGEKFYSVQNCAAAAENMLLAAHSLGVGGNWIGAFDEDKVRDTLGIPQPDRPQVLIPLGYADEIPVMPAKYPIEMVAYINKWRGRVEDALGFLGFTSQKWPKHYSESKRLAKKGFSKLKERFLKK